MCQILRNPIPVIVHKTVLGIFSRNVPAEIRGTTNLAVAYVNGRPVAHTEDENFTADEERRLTAKFGDRVAFGSALNQPVIVFPDGSYKYGYELIYTELVTG